MEKTCIKCEMVKILDDFTKSKTAKDGHRNTCKLCTNLAKKNEKYKPKQREYRLKNKEKKIAYMRSYNANPKNKNRVKQWNLDNKERINELKRNYRKNVIPHVEAWRRLLNRILKQFNQTKVYSTQKMLGYSSTELKNHLEKLFTDDMTWNNYGEWHIDHIRPVITFDKNTHPSIVNALSNLRPMWATTREVNGVIYEGNLNRK